MTILYHGTSLKNYQKIKNSGYIHPRSKTNHPGNWSTNVQGNPNLIYLTDAFSELNALRAAFVANDDHYAIIHIDLKNLIHSNLRVDENYLDYIVRGTSHNGDIVERARQAKEAEYDTRWKESLKEKRLLTYRGSIPIRFIDNVEIIKIEENPFYNDVMFHYSRSPKSKCVIMDEWLRETDHFILPERHRHLLKKYNVG